MASAYRAPVVAAVDLPTGRAMCTPAERSPENCGEGNLYLVAGQKLLGVDTCLVAPTDGDLASNLAESAAWTNSVVNALLSGGGSG